MVLDKQEEVAMAKGYIRTFTEAWRSVPESGTIPQRVLVAAGAISALMHDRAVELIPMAIPNLNPIPRMTEQEARERYAFLLALSVNREREVA